MTAKFNPITVTPTFYQLGTPFFPMYLSIGKDAMLIEGGISATFDIVVEQIALLGIAPERIKYIALTHTHTDHIGALPRFKALWPHLKSIGSPLAAKILSGDNLLTSFKGDDSNISKIMQAKEEIQEIPPDLAEYNFKVDIIANDQDHFDLGNGVVWTAHAIPGHSACQIAYYEEKEGNLAIGDATGFYNPEEDVFWPNYFNSLSKYSDSIKKLARFQAQRIALSHNGIITGNVNIYAFFERALKAAGAYHQEMLEHIEKGADPEAIALEKAKWVHSIADHMPFNIMPVLCRLMIKLSQKEIGNGGLNFQL